jgi:hypothetical protein
MAEPISGVGAPRAAEYAVAVTRKELDQKNLEGQQAVQLIQSATAPALATDGVVGTKLHVVA